MTLSSMISMPIEDEQVLNRIQGGAAASSLTYTRILLEPFEQGDNLLTYTKFGRIHEAIEHRVASMARSGRLARTGVASEIGAGTKH